MAWYDTLAGILRVVAVVVVFSAAVQALAPVVANVYLRTLVGLVATGVVLLLVDVLPAIVRGDRPTLGNDSYLYSARGFAALVAFILIAAVLADWLRGWGALPEWASTLGAAVVAAVLVFGSLVAYYHRRATASDETDSG